MASQWKTLQRLAENLVFNEAPKLIRQLQQSPTVQRGIKIGLDVIVGSVSEPPAEITAGRPVTSSSVPTGIGPAGWSIHPTWTVGPIRAKSCGHG